MYQDVKDEKGRDFDVRDDDRDDDRRASEAASNTTEGQIQIVSSDTAEHLAFHTKIMMALCLANEFMWNFTCFSIELFVIHGLAGFCSEYSCEFIINHLSHVKFTAAVCSIFFGMVFDSYFYRVKYWAMLACCVIHVCWPCLYLVIAFPVYWRTQDAKKIVFSWASLFHGLTLVTHPVRIALILERAFDDYRLPNIRRFVGLLVFSQQLGQFMAGFAIWVARESRKLYAALMCVNIVFSLMYVVFWIFWTRRFPTGKDSQFACVEKTIVSSLCYALKRIDARCCKGVLFRMHPGWQDYRCIRFSELTAQNSWTFLAMLLVILPLVGYFVTDAGLYYLYICQSSNLHPENDETFSVLACKGGYFCLFYPFFELMMFPWFKKMIKNTMVRMLLGIGVGAFLLGLTIAGCAVVQQNTSVTEQEVVNIVQAKGGESFAHVVIVNLLDTDVKVRGEYVNRILVIPPNAWVNLKPFDPFKVLHVSMSNSPFNVTVYSEFFRIYDDYSMPLKKNRFNWWVVHPVGMFALRVGTFHQASRIGMNPKTFGPSFVNVLCRLPVCKGILEFRRNGRYEVRAFFPADSKGGGIQQDLDVRTFRLAGEYEMGFALVGNRSTEIRINVHFERLKVYLLIIKENSEGWEGFDGRSRIEVIEATHQRAKAGLWILYVPPFFHALAYIFAEIGLLEWLHYTSPQQLRGFIFSIPTFLTLITYCFFSNMGATVLTTTGAITIFTYACSIWILLIIYGVACLRFVRMWSRRHTKKPAKHPKKSVIRLQRDTNRNSVDIELPSNRDVRNDEPSHYKDKES